MKETEKQSRVFGRLSTKEPKVGVREGTRKTEETWPLEFSWDDSRATSYEGGFQDVLRLEILNTSLSL